MKRIGMQRLLSLILVSFLIFSMFLTACSKKAEPGNKDSSNSEPADTDKKKSNEEEQKPVTLKYTIFSNEAQDAYTKLDLVGSYKKARPNVTIEIEKVKDTGEFENAMKIRKAANELPDIMPLKPYMLTNFKSMLEPLNDLEAARKNMFAEDFAIDGDILGVPECFFNEFVWYRKSIFEEYNLSVPKTWNQFIDTAKKIKEGGKYTPILMGGKDAWPDYPFNEFMPCLEANDGALWNTMAEQDEPFAKDKPFYKAYTKIQQLYDAKVFGNDPLGVGFDQVKVMFGSKKGAMIASGAWFLSEVQNQLGSDLSDIGTFLLPVRDNENDKLNTVTMVDGFFATPKGGKNTEEAKLFINWLFSEEWYKAYMKQRGLSSTVKDLKTEIDPVLAEAFEGVDINYVLYDGGNEKYKKIESEVKFDVKRMGQEMMSGKNLDKMMEDLNKAWKEARSKLK